MRRIGLAALMEIALPTHTIRVCVGGFVRWGANLFQSSDPVFGVVGSVGELSEGVGEEVPVFEVTFLPPGTTPPSQLSQPGFQTSVAQFWIGEFDIDAGELIGTPELQFIGELDQTTIEFGRDSRSVSMVIVSEAARLLERNIGNAMTSTWHRSIWPCETGHDQATGLGRQVAWGVEGGRASFGSTTVPGFRGGFGLDPNRYQN